MATITRIGFCPDCAKKHYPQKGQTFMAYGSKHQSFICCIADNNGVYGFTPHIYEMNMTFGNQVRYRKICCMEGCGASIEEEGDEDILVLEPFKWSPMSMMSIDNWNALVNFTDTGFKI